MLFRSTLIVAGGFAASKVLGLLRSVVIGHQYGASHEYEMFLAALTVPDTLFQILAGGAVGSAFIPVFTGLLARNDRSGAWRLVSTFANAGILALGGTAILLGFVAPAIVTAIVPGWSAEDHARTANLIRIMLVSPALFAYLFNAQFLGANIAGSVPPLNEASVTGLLLSLAVFSWVAGYLWAHLYNWFLAKR